MGEFTLTPFLNAYRIQTEYYPLVKFTIINIVILLLIQFVGILTNQYFTPDKISCYIIGYLIAIYYCRYGYGIKKWMLLFFLYVNKL